jgi:apolipoprotein N-acyltransferase
MDLWPLAWIAPVPWVLLIRRRELGGGRRPYAMLALVGFLFWMAALHWLRLPHWATSFGWIAMSFCFAFYLPLFVALSHVAVHRLRVPVILAAPMVWTGLELARAHFLTGMTMASLGHTQYRWVELIQLSDLAGEFGVSFVVMFVAAALGRMLPCDDHRWSFWPLMPAAVAIATALVYGHLRTAGDYTSPGPRIALVQRSIDIQMQSDPDQAVRERKIIENRNRIYKEYCELSRAAVEKYRQIDLAVWPESMFPEPIVTFDADARWRPEFGGTDADFRKAIRDAAEQESSGMARPWMAETAKSLDVPLLLGVDTLHFGPKGERLFNSAAYVARDGHLLGRYDKQHLVMFGEYMPLVETFPWLQNFTPLTGSAAAGDRSVAFDVGGVRISPSICYESVLSHVIRRQVNELAAEGQQPDVLVNLTNDGWFWGSSELDMHLACGVFRAVECRKPLVIAANTGFSAWIDGDGRIVEQGPRRATGLIIADVRLDHRRSWYLEHGDWFAGACLAVCIALAVIGLYAVRTSRKSPTT